ncbi:MAG: Ni/Fe hydrogenase subunit alpha [Candidatus Aquicultorales bacterium]
MKAIPKTTFTIEPLTRLEGHGKVTIILNEDGFVESAHFRVAEFRGFEKFCEGRMVYDMPLITTRICGICPVSHHLASVAACDALLETDVPPAARMVRELMNLAQFISSQALHIYFLAMPDFVFGLDTPPEERSIIGLAKKDRSMAEKAIRLRKIGQDSVELTGGRSIHPVSAIPGGMSCSLPHASRHTLRKLMSEAVDLGAFTVDLIAGLIDRAPELVERLGAPPTMYLAMVGDDGSLALTGGRLRFQDRDGGRTDFDVRDYLDYIGERSVDDSWLKETFNKKAGWPEGIYRVGPLARLNVAERIATPKAGAAHLGFKSLGGGKPVHGTIYYHLARAIEVLYAAERALEILEDDAVVDGEVRNPVERKPGEGVGVIEAPRGTLIHHYKADDLGRIEKANFLVATQQNGAAIDLSVDAVAKASQIRHEPSDDAIHAVSMTVRCYDPCLSCSTHLVEGDQSAHKR